MRFAHAFFIVVTGMVSSTAQAQRPTPLSTLTSAAVFIRVQTDSGESTGSGVVVAPNGIIATAAHVMHGARRAQVKLPSGDEYDVIGLLDSDERLDVALIAIAGFGLPTAQFGNSDSVQVGDRLIAVGAPLGLQGTMSDGLLSAVRFRDGTRLFQISIPVSPGSSGGPVATSDGRVIGLVVSGIRGGGAENLNFVIPANYIRGKLGMIAGRAPTPLSGSAYAAARLSNSPPSGLRGVNDSLQTEWALLEGVQYLTELDLGKGAHVTEATRYSTTTNPDGTLTVERVVAMRFRQKVGFRNIDMFDDLRRTLYTVSRENDIVSTVQRTPLVNTVAPFESKLIVKGSGYAVTASGKPDNRGNAAPGVLPPDFIGAPILGYPGALPDKVSFWLLDADTGRPFQVKFELLRRERRRVPVATEAEGCTPTSQTRNVDMPVVVGALTIGVNRTESTYLADIPHLLIGPGLRCVRIP